MGVGGGGGGRCSQEMFVGKTYILVASNQLDIQENSTMESLNSSLHACYFHLVRNKAYYPVVDLFIPSACFHRYTLFSYWGNSSSGIVLLD